MARMTKEERAELEAKLAADDEADPEDDEVELGFGDGSYFRGKYHRARGVAASRGFKLEADPDTKADKPLKATAKDDSEDDGKTTRFGRRVS
jgi:hypothetical protein